MSLFILIPLGLVFAIIALSAEILWGLVKAALVIGLGCLAVYLVAQLAIQTGHPVPVWGLLIGGTIAVLCAVGWHLDNRERQEVFGWSDQKLPDSVCDYGITERRRRAIVEELRRRGFRTPAEEREADAEEATKESGGSKSSGGSAES